MGRAPKRLKKNSAELLHAILRGSWTAQDEHGRWTVYAYNIDGELEAIATGSPMCAVAYPMFYTDEPGGLQ